ncbi:protein yellow-like [Cloeon dipterum]|uniref:protein yellow-like n=1 Tax=Cloeon dipterum TaxID=197152 RepID=UPI00322016BA
MNLFSCAILLLGLSSLAAAANFTQVFEWPNELDHEWPSVERRAQALKDATFNPKYFYPRFMAVYGSRIFLSLEKFNGVPVTLVTMPTSSASSAPPKLTPFPSWDVNGKEGDCDKIEAARGMEIDSVGRLWVLDSGSYNCNAKLWTIDLVKKDHIKLIHRFSFHYFMHDLVIDETANETFAYISRWNYQNIVVFSLEQNRSWIVDTPQKRVLSIALSPKEREPRPRQLYLSELNSNELYSIPVAALNNGTRTANAKAIGKWTATDSCRMLMDNHGTLYAAFWRTHYISSKNTSQPFQGQRFYEVAGLDSIWPFTFALDQSGNFWLTVYDNEKKPKYRLLKAQVGVKSYISEASPVTPTIPSTTSISPKTKTTHRTNQLVHSDHITTKTPESTPTTAQPRPEIEQRPK